MSTPTRSPRSGESGFALILALLSLMLLTVLGLTLATSTTTEVQIAANYRYSRQALYNAEAGLQVARHVLRRMNIGGTVQAALPNARPILWRETDPLTVAQPSPAASDPEDYYPHGGASASSPGCDARGRVGYGRVLNDGVTVYRDVTTWNGLPLQGTFTIWLRRPMTVRDTGEFTDVTDANEVIVTVRGTAPFGAAGLTTEERSRQAVRILEQSLKLESGSPCVKTTDQAGVDQLGSGFDPCGNSRDWTMTGAPVP